MSRLNFRPRPNLRAEPPYELVEQVCLSSPLSSKGQLSTLREALLRQAVVQGSIDRVVPILMTALCTRLALVPVALGAGEPGSEIQAPMAGVIIFGLVSSTAPNMLVVSRVLRVASRTCLMPSCAETWE